MLPITDTLLMQLKWYQLHGTANTPQKSHHLSHQFDKIIIVIPLVSLAD